MVLFPLHGLSRLKTVALNLLLLIGVLCGGGWPDGAFASTSVGGSITANTTWTVVGSPYLVTSTVQIIGTASTSVTLTIEPGVIVKFNAGAGMLVSSSGLPGVLNAAGTAATPIVFTSIKDDTAGGDTNGDGSLTVPAPGNWGSLLIQTSASSPSLLDHVEVRYGGSGSLASIRITNSSPTIRNGVIEKSSTAGFFIQAGSVTTAPQILNNQIRQNATYGIQTQGIIALPVGGLIQGNAILSSGQYGLYFDGIIGAVIQNNQIAKSLYFTSQGGSPPTLTGNQITEIGSVVTQVPADVIEMLQAQNTLEGITPTTSLYVIGDTLSGTTTLTTIWNSYVVNSGSISVNGTAGNPSTLVVQAGVRLLFAAGAGITVGSTTGTPGILKVYGTAAAPVLFSRLTTSGWSGLSLNAGTVGAQTIVQHAIIEYANPSADPSLASLSIANSSPILENVTVRLSSPSGIKVQNGSPTMTGVTIDQMGGDGITITSGLGTVSAPVISQALIKTVGRHGIYMTMVGGSNTPTLQNSTIQTPAGYGVYITQSAVPTLLNNTINGSVFMDAQNVLPTVTGNTINNFNTKTARISVAMLQQFQTQNTLNDIDPATVLELTGIPTVSTNTTIGTRWNTYNVVGPYPITVSGSPPAMLTILPGVTMRFGAGLYLNIGGAQKGILLARGTASAPILLTALTAAPNNWRGILLNGTAVPGASRLDYVTVDQAGSVDAAVRAITTAFAMTHCIIRNSSRHGIELYSTDLTMQFCQVSNNGQSGLLVDSLVGSTDNSRVEIANSDVFGNAQGAMTNNQPAVAVNARNNWWGDASGPGGSGQGSGSSISAGVLYDPWLGAAFTYPFAITGASPSSTALTPGGGETTLAGNLTQSGNWTAQITDSANTVLKTASGAGRVIGMPWDGADSSGTPQPNGTYTYRIDASASGAAAPVLGRLQLNTALPIAKISQPGPEQLILTPSVAISGTAAGSNFSSYSVDVGVGASPFEFIPIRTNVTAPVTNGALAAWTIQADPPSSLYQIRLSVTGAGGTAVATQLISIDKLPPLPPLLTPPVSPSATQPITVSGAAEGDSTVELYVNDVRVSQTTASEAGAFTFNGVTLTLGLNSLKARATDAAGNVSAFSSNTSVIYLPPGESLIEILSPTDGSTVYK